jgi:hypothetical protein
MPPIFWNRFDPAARRRAFTPKQGGRGLAHLMCFLAYLAWRSLPPRFALSRISMTLLPYAGAHAFPKAEQAPPKGARSAIWPDHDIEGQRAPRWQPRRRKHG